jgi:hypothetical protein
MDLSAALRAGPALLRRRAAAILPYYLLAASAPAMARVPALVCVGAAVAYLAATGRLDPLFGALDGFEPGTGSGVGTGPEPTSPSPADPTALPGGPDAVLPPELVAALRGLVTPTTVLLVLAGALASLVVLVVARGATAAGALAAVDAGLRGEDPLPAGAAGIRRHWSAFVALAVLRAGAYLSAGALLVAVGVAAPLVAALLFVPLSVALLGLELVLAFAGPAIVVDDVDLLGGLRGALGLATRRPAAYLLLLVVGAAAFVGLAVVGLTLAVAGAARVAGLLSVLVVFPAVDGVRVALYAGRDPPLRLTADSTPDGVSDGGSIAGGVRRVGRTLRDGLGALAGFVRDHPGANVGGAAFLAAGVAAGWRLTAPHGVTFPAPSDPGAAFGAVPVDAFLNIAANNWLVAASASYGGVAVGLPTAAALLFNGALIGALAGVFEPVTVLGLVVPHGIVELPAIAVAGGLGLHLGRVGWAALRGRRSAAAVGEELGTTLRVLVGLAVVFVVAAGIEAFVTPLVGAALLG